MKSISLKWLLAIYIVVPLSLLFCIGDQIFNGSNFKLTQPYSSTDLTWFTLFFVLPHIMGSLISFADKEYIQNYNKKLYFYVALAFGLPWILQGMSQILFQWVLVVWTMLHVVGQQIGITGMILRIKDGAFKVWKYSFLIAVTARLSLVALNIPLSDVTTSPWWKMASVVVGGSLLISSGILFSRAQTSMGRWYLAANCLMALSAWYFTAIGYLFLSTLMFRLVHDITGFTFYAVHDANRNNIERKNGIFSLLKWIPFPVLFLCPVLGILMALPLTYFQYNEVVFNIMSGFVLLHYLTDAFVWKQGSLHRESIKIS